MLCRQQRAKKSRGRKGKLIELLLSIGQIPCQLLKPESPGVPCHLNLHGMGTKPPPPQDSGEPQSTGWSEIMFCEIPISKEGRLSGRILNNMTVSCSSPPPRQW